MGRVTDMLSAGVRSAAAPLGAKITIRCLCSPRCLTPARLPVRSPRARASRGAIVGSTARVREMELASPRVGQKLRRPTSSGGVRLAAVASRQPRLAVVALELANRREHAPSARSELEASGGLLVELEIAARDAWNGARLTSAGRGAQKRSRREERGNRCDDRDSDRADSESHDSRRCNPGDQGPTPHDGSNSHEVTTETDGGRRGSGAGGGGIDELAAGGATAATGAPAVWAVSRF